MVSCEVAGIHDDAPKTPRQAESDYAPVETRGPAPPRLPAVHPLSGAGVLAFEEDRLAGLEEAFLRGEELIVGENHGAAQAFGCKINQINKFHHNVSRETIAPRSLAKTTAPPSRSDTRSIKSTNSIIMFRVKQSRPWAHGETSRVRRFSCPAETSLRQHRRGPALNMASACAGGVASHRPRGRKPPDPRPQDQHHTLSQSHPCDCKDRRAGPGRGKA